MKGRNTRRMLCFYFANSKLILMEEWLYCAIYIGRRSIKSCSSTTSSWREEHQVVSLRIFETLSLWRWLRLLRSVCNNSSLCLPRVYFTLPRPFDSSKRQEDPPCSRDVPPLLQSSAPRLSWESVARQLWEPTDRVQMAVCGEMSHLCVLCRFSSFLFMVPAPSSLHVEHGIALRGFLYWRVM